MSQLELKPLPPATHSGDPASSHRAEARITQSGRRQQHARYVLNLVRAYPMASSDELSEKAAGSELFDACPNCRRQQIAKRLSDLHAQGKVKQHRPPGARFARWEAV